MKRPHAPELPEEPGQQPAEDARPGIMKELAVTKWVNVPQAVIDLMVSPLFPNPVRIYALVIRQSWGYRIPYALGQMRKGRLQTTYTTALKHVVQLPLRRVDIAEALGMDEANVTRIVQRLFGDGRKQKGICGRIEGKRFFPEAHPSPMTLKKLSDLTTLYAEDPVYQQLSSLMTEYRGARLDAIQKALEPVKKEYLPKLEKVKRQFKAVVKANAAAGGPSKVGKDDNSQDVTPITPTRNDAIGPPAASVAELGKSDNSQPVTPLERLGRNDNQISGRNVPQRPKKQPHTGTAPVVQKTVKAFKTRSGAAVGRSVVRDKTPTDRPTLSPLAAQLKTQLQKLRIPALMADPPRPELLERIAALLAPIAEGPALFLSTVRTKARKVTSAGLLLNFAEAIADAHTEEDAEPPRRKEPEQTAAACPKCGDSGFVLHTGTNADIRPDNVCHCPAGRFQQEAATA